MNYFLTSVLNTHVHKFFKFILGLKCSLIK